jgi:hypothetical protein
MGLCISATSEWAFLARRRDLGPVQAQSWHRATLDGIDDRPTLNLGTVLGDTDAPTRSHKLTLMPDPLAPDLEPPRRRSATDAPVGAAKGTRPAAADGRLAGTECASTDGR